MSRFLPQTRLLTAVGATFTVLFLSGFQACEITVTPVDNPPAEPDPTEPAPPPDQSCFADSDCPGDSVCEFTGDCLPYPCAEGEACPDVCAPQGFCSAPNTGDDCWDLDLDICQDRSDCAIEEMVPPCAPPNVGDHGSMMPAECGPSEFVCVPRLDPPPPPPESCNSDVDCGFEAHCEVYEYCYSTNDCMGMNGSDEPGAIDCMPAEDDCGFESVCVPNDPPPPPSDECFDDADCGQGSHCEIYEDCWAMPVDNCDAPDGMGCDETYPCESQAICVPDDVPPPSECNLDADCGAGGRCETYDNCAVSPTDCADPSGADCNMDPAIAPCFTESICIYDVPPTGQCDTDADCAVNELCEIMQACAEPAPCQPSPDGTGNCGGMAPPCYTEGYCVPADAPPPPSECRADSDCSADTHCELFDICYPGDCGPNGDCYSAQPCGTQGMCVPNDPPPPPANECFDDADCGQGSHCEITETCPACSDDPNMPCGAPCFIEGQCVEDAPTAPPAP